MTSNKWGGTRKGAGRPKVEEPKKTVVVRVDELLLPAIKILKQRHQSGEEIENLFTVTNNQNKAKESEHRSHAPANTIDILGENKALQERINELTIKSNEEVIKAAELEGELNKYKAANLKLVQRYDTEHVELVQIQSKRLSNQSEIKNLKQEVERLKHLEYDCQALTKAGFRCTRPAKAKTRYKGIEINTCNQHSNIK